ncbi:hypothetical protein MHK_009594 [Candidatus Magnetomorum sp. HK-1]|nr:hypothetical protein MHK_009594 [Candidatus Magnetomorum sp. HK-1]
MGRLNYKILIIGIAFFVFFKAINTYAINNSNLKLDLSNFTFNDIPISSIIEMEKIPRGNDGLYKDYPNKALPKSIKMISYILGEKPNNKWDYGADWSTQGCKKIGVQFSQVNLTEALYIGLSDCNISIIPSAIKLNTPSDFIENVYKQYKKDISHWSGNNKVGSIVVRNCYPGFDLEFNFSNDGSEQLSRIQIIPNGKQANIEIINSENRVNDRKKCISNCKAIAASCEAQCSGLSDKSSFLGTSPKSECIGKCWYGEELCIKECP